MQFGKEELQEELFNLKDQIELAITEQQEECKKLCECDKDCEEDCIEVDDADIESAFGEDYLEVDIDEVLDILIEIDDPPQHLLDIEVFLRKPSVTEMLEGHAKFVDEREAIDEKIQEVYEDASDCPSWVRAHLDARAVAEERIADLTSISIPFDGWEDFLVQ